MADSKPAEELTDASALTGAEIVYVVQGGNSRKTTTDALWKMVPYDVPMGFAAGPTASELMLAHVFAHAVTFPDDWAGAQKYVGTNPTASYTLTIKKNGSTVGTAVIGTGGAVTFATSGGATAFAVGDVMTVHGAVTPDATLANVALTFPGVRQ